MGVVKPHHRFLLSELFTQIETLDEAITRVSNEIATRMREEEPVGQGSAEQPCGSPNDKQQQTSSQEPRQASEKAPLTWTLALMLLCTIAGIGQRAAEGILAEIGLNMARFPSAGHLASWAGMCPGNNESAGKRLSGKTRKGNPWLRILLVEAAHAAAHTKNTYLSAQYHRLAARRGKKKAMIAVGQSILVIISHLLQEQQSYEELGANYFDERERQATEKRLVHRLEKLGYQVTLQSDNPAA